MSKEEEGKLVALKKAVGPLQGRASLYCSDACLHRYLRARNWDVAKAEKMLKNTLNWRASFKPEEIKWEDVASEAETGKLYRTNFLDKKGDTVLVMSPGRQNTNDHDSQMRHLVYCLENAVLNLPPTRETMVWIIDFTGWTLAKSPPLKTARETLNILQNHYPERLGLAICYSPPAVFEAFFRMVKPFIDPKTSKKIRFIYPKQKKSTEVLEQLFDLDTLERSFGGRSTWVYDHEAYSRLMKEDDNRMAKKYNLLGTENGLKAEGATAVGTVPTGTQKLK